MTSHSNGPPFYVADAGHLYVPGETFPDIIDAWLMRLVCRAGRQY